MRIAYLGPEGTFTERAARDLFPSGEFLPIQPIRGVVFSVENEKTDFGVIPL